MRQRMKDDVSLSFTLTLPLANVRMKDRMTMPASCPTSDLPLFHSSAELWLGTRFLAVSAGPPTRQPISGANISLQHSSPSQSSPQALASLMMNGGVDINRRTKSIDGERTTWWSMRRRPCVNPSSSLRVMWSVTEGHAPLLEFFGTISGMA